MNNLLHTPVLGGLSLLHLFLLFLPCSLTAHQPGNSSLVLEVVQEGKLQGEYHVATVDMESIRLMVEDRMSRAAARTGMAAQGSASKYVEGLEWISFQADGKPVGLDAGPAVPVETDGVVHLMVPFTLSFGDADVLRIHFEEFFGFDPQHRVVVSLAVAGDTKVGLLTLNEPDVALSLSAPGTLGQFVKFTWEGVWHIWIGIDHILFLIALLLPSVLRFEAGTWRPVASFKDASYTVVKLVTAFTIAHSITLSLAALEIVSLPSRLVESAIAASVAIAALNNIYQVVRVERLWTVAFGFGLLHGFGFANVLANLQLPADVLAISLLSFNIGVELGQMVIVALVFPLIFLLRSHPLYLPVTLRLLSSAITVVALAWMADRVLALRMMPF